MTAHYVSVFAHLSKKTLKRRKKLIAQCVQFTQTSTFRAGSIHQKGLA
jgi:hypothetical protein